MIMRIYVLSPSGRSSYPIVLFFFLSPFVLYIFLTFHPPFSLSKHNLWQTQRKIDYISDHYYYTTTHTTCWFIPLSAVPRMQIKLGHGYPHEDRHATKNGVSIVLQGYEWGKRDVCFHWTEHIIELSPLLCYKNQKQQKRQVPLSILKCGFMWHSGSWSRVNCLNLNQWSTINFFPRGK